MDSENCLFCQIPEDRVIYRLRDFLLCVGLGPIIPGHILIIPNKHIKSFTNLSVDQNNAFNSIRSKIKMTFEKHFGSCLMFEHGNHYNNGGLHSHAHLHVIPIVLQNDIRYFIQAYNPVETSGGYGSEESEQFVDQEYLFLDGVNNGIEIPPRFYTFQGWPQKYFVRYLVLKASQRNLRELDWEKYPKIKTMKKTIEITKSIMSDKGG